MSDIFKYIIQAVTYHTGKKVMKFRYNCNIHAITLHTVPTSSIKLLFIGSTEYTQSINNDTFFTQTVHIWDDVYIHSCNYKFYLKIMNSFQLNLYWGRYIKSQSPSEFNISLFQLNTTLNLYSAQIQLYLKKEGWIRKKERSHTKLVHDTNYRYSYWKYL